MSSKYEKLTISAVMIALAFVLSYIKLFSLPNGGSITAASMVPIVILGFKYSTKWCVLCGLVFSALQMLAGFYPPVSNTFLAYVGVIMLDYVIAFGALGLSGLIVRRFKSDSKISFAVAGFCVMFIRFICSFSSGILIWGSFAPEEMPVWLYSLTYNGSYMSIEIAISVIVILALTPVIRRLFKMQPIKVKA